MPLIQAAVCHEFSSPLVVEPVLLRDPGAHEVQVTLGLRDLPLRHFIR